jgi:hypothetical protein
MPDDRYGAMVAQIARILLRVESSGTRKNRHDSVLAVKLRQAAAPTRSAGALALRLPPCSGREDEAGAWRVVESEHGNEARS